MLSFPSDVRQIRDENWTTLLHVAAEAGNSECVKFLLSQCCDPNIKDQALLTPLHLAAGAGRKRCIRLLLRAGALKNERDIWGWNPLHRAVINHHFETAEILMKAGCSVNQPDENKRVVLHVAASYGHRLLLRRLIKSGADVNWQDARGRTPLYLAVVCRHMHIVEDLCRRYNCNMNLPTTSHITPLSLAAQKGHEEFVRLFIDCGAHCSNTRNERGDPVPLESVLLRALNRDSKKFTQYLQIARLLLQAGGEPPSPQTFYLALRHALLIPSITEDSYHVIHLLFVAGVKPEVFDLEQQACQNLAPCVQSWIKLYLRSAVPLKDHCRRVIRQQLHLKYQNVVYGAKHLQIPKLLKDIILLNDI